jgi:septin family protein
MKFICNELPISSFIIAKIKHSARLAITYHSRVIGTSGPDRSFFMNSLPQRNATTLEVCLKPTENTQFNMISFNKSRLFVSLDKQVKDDRFNFKFLQLIGTTHK